MMATRSNETSARPAGNLVVKVSGELKKLIQSGEFKPGMKLPSEAKLTEAYGVSRTVIREAVAALRADGLVEARQGAGVFVLEAQSAETLPFHNLDYDRVSSVIELLELRTGVEVEAAGLAALRRSPQQEEAIINCHRQVLTCLEAGQPTAEADFALHLAIADAANNPRFREFLTMIGSGVIPRAALQSQSDTNSADYIARIHDEHSQIIEAISNGDEEAARSAMRRHLKGSQMRYRSILRQVRSYL
ncbi:DNA-binding FadR family transcriptional regulator [Ochrobactrum sp. P6BSIII]|uniref:FadR/GntR family transcriptional regulator n=1 Tax=unclassified Ochrobactrum TaxID=239106 RepID=UPI0017CF445B|nr:DNA-binding FadR family transcriptional regulator [Ochrobactrum sp. P6BSIII]